MDRRTYARRTKVPVERSLVEIQRLVMKYGATAFQHGIRQGLARIMFEMNERRVGFDLPLPTEQSKGTESQKEQETRRRWRALAIVVKAKLEAVESGITTFEMEFYAHILLPNGKTVYQESRENVEMAYKSGRMQPLLGDGK